MVAAGQLLVATPGRHSVIFDKTVILLLDHHGEGSMGLVLNRPSELPVREALPDLHLDADPDVIYLGGPVEEGVALILADARSTGVDLQYRCGDVGLVDLSTLDVDPTTIDGRSRVFSGYAGWSAGQLDAELRQDAWIVADAVATDPWQHDGSDFWRAVLRRQPGEIRFLASYPDQPEYN